MPSSSNKTQWKLNTSNKGKLQEFQRLFAKYGHALSASYIDLAEIQADPIKVIAHKASQLEEGILVDDTSLDIEGSEVGINVRWLMDHLEEFVGRKANWTVLLAYRQKSQVFIYAGRVEGVIVPSQGNGGFGFDPVFLPNGEEQTLALSKPDNVNARAMAVEALIHGHPVAIVDALYDWKGSWQGNKL